MVELIYLGLANGVISYTITKSFIFESFRMWIWRNATPEKPYINWFYELFSCPYCLSHWVAVAMVAIWQPLLTSCSFSFLDLFISIFLNVLVASISWGWLSKLNSTLE